MGGDGGRQGRRGLVDGHGPPSRGRLRGPGA
jgi:hypothetical protein